MRKKILAVDDDPLYVDLVRDIFSAEDIDVISAQNGIEALSILKTQQPSLIISDFEMPRIDGIEFHSQLQQDQKTKSIPFVFMTGASSQALIQYAKLHNIHLLNKSNIVKELLGLIKELK